MPGAGVRNGHFGNVIIAVQKQITNALIHKLIFPDVRRNVRQYILQNAVDGRWCKVGHGLRLNGGNNSALAFGTLNVGVQSTDSAEHQGFFAVQVDAFPGVKVQLIAGQGPTVPGSV